MTKMCKMQSQALTSTLIAARKAAGMSQQQLANQVGRSKSFICKIEADASRLNILDFIEIADILGKKPSELIGAIDIE